ncbi:MAG: carboxypeptidase-like regulatory domain-containing protein [Ignavibacteriales bacterium]|nr:carboxypeptidase-like regulatory domain-containing protein [Ignavibacteriales bacterium]
MKRNKRSAAILVAVVLLQSVVFSQTSKLVGTVTDGTTKEALIGVNIIIVGTNIGAITDVNGRYSILNVPPGRYNVKASMLGYATVTQQHVDIFIDRTTTADFQMRDATIELNQVVVVATKPPVIRDRTATATTIESSQISAAPIEGLRGAMDLYAGFQKSASGEYSVRGSGSYELNFQINGIDQLTSNTSAPGEFGADKANNSWKYDVNPIGVQQMELITGGFSAEYGNAQAGVVKVAMKEGTQKLTGEFRVEYRPPGQYHYGQYLYDHSNYEWQKWGTIDKWMANRTGIAQELQLDVRYGYLKSTDSAQYNQIVDKEIAWAYQTWVKNHEPGDNNVLGVYDYRQYAYQRYMFGFGGPLGDDPNRLKFYLSGEYKRNPTRLPSPEKVQTMQNYVLSVTYQPIQNNKIKIMGNYQNYLGGLWDGSDDIRWSGLSGSPPNQSRKYDINFDAVRSEQTIAQSINWVHTINAQSFLDITLAHQQERYELPYIYLPGYGQMIDRLDSAGDVNGTVLRNGTWWESNYFTVLERVSTNWYQDSRTETYSLKADYANQITQTNLLKTGIAAHYYDMQNTGVYGSYQANSFVARNGFAEYYRAYPVDVAAYVQDKMEYSGMIANIGLRAEMYNFHARVPEDKFNFLYPGTDGPSKVGNPETMDSETKYVVQPRLGISFPVGTGTALRIQYGHFASMPTFSQALSNMTYQGWNGIGNPNLEPKKTINYEIGLQQAIGDEYRSDFVLYYNDRATQIGSQSIAAYTGSRMHFVGFSNSNELLNSYSTYTNNGFGSTIGFEATFETIGIDHWSYRLSYSLSQTTAGNYGSNMVYPDNSRNFSTRNYTGEFIASSDRTHNFRGLLQYRWAAGEGFRIFGVNLIQNSVVGMTYTAQSGTPYTYITDFSLRDAVYNRRYPIESNVDVNFSKSVEMGTIKMLIGIRVMNLFENKWLTPPANSTDLNDWVQRGVTVADPGTDPTRIDYVVASYAAYRNIPRQVFFTLGVGFN